MKEGGVEKHHRNDDEYTDDVPDGFDLLFVALFEKHCKSHVSIKIDMRELEKRQRVRRRMYSIPVVIGLMVITAFFAKGAYSMLVVERRSAEEAQILADKVSALAEREAYLEGEIARLNTEAGIEEEFKSKYNVARPGELVALIVDGKEVATTTEEDITWWKRMWNAIIAR